MGITFMILGVLSFSLPIISLPDHGGIDMPVVVSPVH